MRTVVRSLLLTVVLLAARSASAATALAVTAQGTSAYLFNGTSPNGTLTLTRGQTYTFQVSATGHPFHITTAPGLPIQDFVDPGLTNNGASNGTVTFTVPTANSPAQLFYQCSVHSIMSGTINLVAATSVPATGTLGLTLVAAASLLAGLLLLRRRARA
ncbi:MAG: hypothetical protein ABUS79_29035 [Pseudomonadota bacterium]